MSFERTVSSVVNLNNKAESGRNNNMFETRGENGSNAPRRLDMARYWLSPSVVGMRRVLQNKIKRERVSSWMENWRRMIRKALRILR